MAAPPPPPPPPPHGESPKTTAGGSGLPPGKYDVFIIPEHSAGAGFLYLPSLRTNTNSFIAGFACALIMVVVGQSMAPAFQAWWANFQGMGNAGMMLLVVAVGLGAWSLGRQTSDSSGRGGGGAAGGGAYPFGGGPMPGGGGFSSAGSSPHSAHHGSPPNAGPPPNAHSPPPPGGSTPSANNPNGSYQRPPPQPQPQPSTTKPQAETPKNSWAKAREEVRRKEEERKAKQAEEKRRSEAAQRLKELREKEARERAQREADKARREQEAKEKDAKEREAKEREAQEKEAKERRERELREARTKELTERLAREREERRKKLEEERRRKEEEASQTNRSSAYSYSSVGEKTNPWPNGKPPTTPSPSPTKRPPAPTARTFVGSEEDAYSYRPYDQPKRPARRNSNSDMSESSWAPSQSTARTTPPPSVRGPYSTKDPDKIVIKAVYCFMNQYAKTPASQLISGVGSVTEGLILRVTTEGLFIDDDLRGVAQREWDVKAWTLKMVEVWCPVHFLACAIAANSPPPPKSSAKKTTPATLSANDIDTAFFAKTMGGTARLRAAERSAPKTFTGDDADAYLTEMLRSCKDSCRLGDCALKFAATASNSIDDASSVASGSTRDTNTTAQTGDYKAKGLHLLRATIRDQEGKRYLFVIGEEEGWKVAVGLQRLRRGTQARALGVAGLSGLDTKSTLEMLGWG